MVVGPHVMISVSLVTKQHLLLCSEIMRYCCILVGEKCFGCHAAILSCVCTIKELLLFACL